MYKTKQLYYKKGRRYYEYIKNKDIPNNQLYYIDSSDGELIPYNSDTMEWFNYNGIPKAGIWKVHDSGYSWIGDYDITDFRIELEKYRDIMLTAVDNALKACDNKFVSQNDIVSEILNQLDKLNQLNAEKDNCKD